MSRLYTDKIILTPGPTEIHWRVRQALSRKTTNPDIDRDFYYTYSDVVLKLKKLLGADRSSLYVLAGEAIMGLEIAISNIVKKGDKILVLSNGVYGEGFAEFVKAYGGVPVIVSKDWRESFSREDIKKALDEHSDVKVLTLVHCDTPSGILNPLQDVILEARRRGVLTIVDAVSTIGAMPIGVDTWGIDILIGGSQKALGCPPGLTIITVSEYAWDAIREKNPEGYYMNLLRIRESFEKEKIFPYTMPESLIYALNEALDILMFEEGLDNVYRRHLLSRKACWNASMALGLEPYPLKIEYSSPTVTALLVPQGLSVDKIIERAWRIYGVLFASSWGKLRNRILRIGHMGQQASRNHVLLGFITLARVLEELGWKEVKKEDVINVIESAFR